MTATRARVVGLLVAMLWLVPAACAAESDAATASGSTASGTLPGILAGVVLAMLFGYALWTYAEPLIREGDRTFGRVLIGLLVLWAFKTLALGIFTGYALDLGTFEAWAMRMVAVGPAHMYSGDVFLDYPPGYLYALWLAAWLANLFGASGDIFRIFIETPALAADFILAAVAYIFLRRQGKPRAALIATLLIALNPALLFDSVGWGQTDPALALTMFLSALMLLDGEYELGGALPPFLF